MEIQMQMQGAAQLLTMLHMAPDIATKHLVWATEESLNMLQREIAEATPTGAHQLLRDTIIAQPVAVGPFGVRGIVGTSVKYAIPVELGTKPHMPPLEPLIDWVIKTGHFPIGQRSSIKTKKQIAKPTKGSIAMATEIAKRIQWKISHHGTKGHFMFRDTFTRLEPAVNAYFEQARQLIIAEMAAKGQP